MDELKALIQELKELIAVLKQGTPVNSIGTPPVLDNTGYPKNVVFDGVTFHLYRPINPKWKPSQYAKMFGKHQVLNDPSLETTPDGFPSRSEAGYPLVYNFVKDGKPYKPAVILYGEQTFNTDEEVEAYIKATTKTPEEIEQARKQWEERDRKILESQKQNQNPPAAPPNGDDIYIV